jgi:hypothetical protein
MQSLTIAQRFRGPPNSGNGGYVCGLLARHIPGAAQVSLRRPPPLETPLGVHDAGDGVWELRNGDTTVAIGRSVALEPTRIETASFSEAAAAEERTPVKPHDHLLPMCFVCGPERAHGDGLRIFAGPLERRMGGNGVVFAATWTPYANLVAADGLVAPEFVWSALDCPTGYVFLYDPETGSFRAAPILLGTLAVRIDARPRAEERCVVTAWETGRDGRKLNAEAALFGEAGNLLAVARATWIMVDRQVQLGAQ